MAKPWNKPDEIDGGEYVQCACGGRHVTLRREHFRDPETKIRKVKLIVTCRDCTAQFIRIGRDIVYQPPLFKPAATSTPAPGAGWRGGR